VSRVNNMRACGVRVSRSLNLRDSLLPWMSVSNHPTNNQPRVTVLPKQADLILCYPEAVFSAMPGNAVSP